MAELLFPYKVKSVQTDNGTEFKPLVPYFASLVSKGCGMLVGGYE